MMDDIWVSGNIVHIGALLYLAGFLFRNQIILRSLIIVGDFVYILYFTSVRKPASDFALFH